MSLSYAPYIQLRNKDVAPLEALIGSPPSTALVRGRSNINSVPAFAERFVGSVAEQSLDDEYGDPFDDDDVLAIKWINKNGVKYRIYSSEMAKALEMIDEFLKDEYGENAGLDLLDVRLDNIPIAYTTVESDESLEIQIEADLVNKIIRTKIGGIAVSFVRYKSLEEMIVFELQNLSFDTLVSVSEEEIEKARKALREIKKSEKAHIVWSNEDLNLEDWRDDIIEDIRENGGYRSIGSDPEDYDDDALSDIMCEMNMAYLDDEMVNLRVTVDAPIVVLGNLGLWDGIHRRARVIDPGVVSNCLGENGALMGCEYATWFVDPFGDFRYIGHHHDGTNTCLYRKMKAGVSEEERSALLEAFVNNAPDTEQQIESLTESLKPVFESVYGWHFDA